MNWNYARYGLESINKFGEYEILIYEEQHREERFTNVELSNRSNALANGLTGLGIERGDIVAVILPNSPAVPISYMGIFKIGAVFLPVIFGLTAPEIRYILEDSQAVAIITNEELYPKIKEASKGLETVRHMIIIDNQNIPGTTAFESLIANNSVDYEMAVMERDDLAVLMYTSGTTGFPKGVMLSHWNIGSNLEHGLPSWPTDKSDVYLVPLPLNHIYGMLMVNECNITGATLIIHKGFDPTLVLKSITEHQVTVFVGVPTMYIMLLQMYDPAIHKLSSIRRWISAAAPLSVETLRMVEEKLGGVLYQGYGMTETSPTISRQPVGRDRKPGSVGTPIKNVEIGIFDDLDQELLVDKEGEICVRGPNVMKGYLNKPQETEAALKNGWMHTGDMGYLDKDGDLFITDRKKDLIIRGGENISPGAIEEILYKNEEVLEAAVVGVPDPVYGEEVKAFVILRPGFQISEQDLIDQCVKAVSRFKAPKSVTFLNEFPKSSVGKILKRELRKMG
ncbi:MAG: AMP-binding protein [Deltaproteobacteria bacterium]|nr:AMP-binding protein [Deltaproteobacteria bacterium]